jgi:hypothetical protein
LSIGSYLEVREENMSDVINPNLMILT